VKEKFLNKTAQNAVVDDTVLEIDITPLARCPYSAKLNVSTATKTLKTKSSKRPGLSALVRDELRLSPPASGR